GFYCIGESAQVPSGVKVGAYRTQRDVVDFGIGMRPDLTGQGLGTEFLAHVLGQIVSDYLCADIRLTVAAFNNRAIRLYERFGFQMGIKFDHNGCVFQVMTRPHDD
ncbi:MAG: GNAT family N-acetyltransferase, partial [Firmicutes bacterium]|nr:GNAT family N-acetyltransferase [Bacillota bacterium]